jgi:Flp pilus assembly protein TadG
MGELNKQQRATLVTMSASQTLTAWFWIAASRLRAPRNDVLRRFNAANRAVASIEFAISGMALILFMLAIVNLGDLGLVLGAMQHGAESAARSAAVQSSSNIANGSACSNTAAVQSYFNAAASPPLPAATGSPTDGTPQIQTSWTNNGANNTIPGTYVTVKASYNWTPIGLPNTASIPLNITATQIVLGTSGVTTSCSS